MITRRNVITGAVAAAVTGPAFAAPPFEGSITWERYDLPELGMKCTVSRRGGRTMWGWTPVKDFWVEKKHLEEVLISSVMRPPYAH